MNVRAATTSLLDDVLPAYDFHEVHDVFVPGPPEQAYAAVKAVSAREIRVLGPLMSVRRLPATLSRRRRVGFEGPGSALDQFLRAGFVVLGERPGTETVIGAVGRFWSPTSNQPVETVRTRADFVAFAEPGYAKAAMNFVVSPETRGSRVTTETRVAGTDSRATSIFRLYWALIRLPSGLIRISLLNAVRRRVERGKTPAG
jgi:hypothetical protein